MITASATPKTIERRWYVVDATDKTLGRLASNIAHHLRGKHKAYFTPHLDTGDFIIVVNANKMKVTGDKLKKKVYYSHTGYPGGIKARILGDRMTNQSDEVLRDAIKGMMPKGPLGRQMLRKLKVYAGAEHEHQAQQPESLDIEE